MIPIEKAIKIIARETRTVGTERIDIENSVGRVLAQNIVADSDLPPFDRSQMDGYAVIAANTINAPAKLNIVGESAAGRGWHKKLIRGEAVRIMTGAPVPAGADAVQRVELTSDVAFIENKTVTILEPVKKGTAIVRRGSEIKKGKIVIKAGEIVTPNNIATAAAFGYAKVWVAKRPRIAIMSTGSEIVSISKKPAQDQIRNSNSVMLKALAEANGAECSIFPSSGDDLSDLKFQISNAAKGRDVLIITGGVSVGKYDLTKAALADLGAQVFFDKIKLKPGKPMVFARLGKTLVFGLPGNPVSAAVTFYLFVRSAILRIQSARSADLIRGWASLSTDARAAKDRDTMLPARLQTDATGRLTATQLRSQGSSDLVSIAQADSLIFLQAGERLSKGEVAPILFL